MKLRATPTAAGAIFLGLALTLTANAQVVLNAVGTPVVIDFTGFTAAGFQATPTAGQLDSDAWSVFGFSDGDLAFGGTGTSGDYARGLLTADSSTGGIYAADAVAGRAFVIQPSSNDFTPGSITLRVLNNSGAILTQLGLSYDIVSRNNASNSSSWNFTHSADNSSFTNVAGLDFATPTTADGFGWTPTPRGTTLTGLNISPGAFYYLRWSSNDLGSGTRDELGLDNIVITPIPEPGTIGLLLLAGLAGARTVQMNRRKKLQA